MKHFAFLLLFVFNAGALTAQSYKELIQTADAKYRQKDYAQSTQFFQKAFKIESLYVGFVNPLLHFSTKIDA